MGQTESAQPQSIMASSPLVPGLSSPEVQAFATGFPVTLAHGAATLGLLLAGVVIYSLMTPWKELEQLRRGNVAAALAFAGVLLGLAIPLTVSLSASTSLRDILIWGAATLVLQLLAFRIVDLLLPGLARRIVEAEVSAGIVLFAAKLATALVLAGALGG